MSSEGKFFNLKLDAKSAGLLDTFAKAGHCSQAQVLRDCLLSAGEITTAALIAQQELFAEWIEQIGEDATIIIFATADDDGEPVVHVNYSWASWEPAKDESVPAVTAYGVVDGDRLRIFLDPGEHGRTAVVRVGGQIVRIAGPAINLVPTSLSWPPKPHEAIRIEVGEWIRDGFDPAGTAANLAHAREVYQELANTELEG